MNEQSSQIIEIPKNNQDIDIIQPLPVTAIIRRRDSVLEIFQQVMKSDTHYGTIPGCGDKPVLLKPGAETICNTFQVAPEYEISKTELPNNHREYEIKCNLYTIANRRFVGSGLGSASTMESKHRWRNDFENTGEEVPKAYWKDRDQSLIGGKGFSPKKVDGVWFIHKSEGKVENPDPADCYNTVLKMGKKRAYVDAVISTFGVSDMFTQDLEENQPEEKQQKQQQQTKKSQEPDINSLYTAIETKRKKITEILKVDSITDTDLHEKTKTVYDKCMKSRYDKIPKNDDEWNSIFDLFEQMYG